MELRKEMLNYSEGREQWIACMTRHLDASQPQDTGFYDLHYHEYIELLYGIKGTATAMIGEHLYPLGVGDLIIVNAREAHSVACTSGRAQYYVIKFLPKILYAQGQSLATVRYLLPLWQKEVAFSPVLKAEELCKSHVGNLVEEIMREWSHKSKGYELVMQANIMQIFVWMVRHRCPTREGSGALSHNLQKSLEAVLEETHKHLEDWTARDAARFCNLSYSYFSRNFKLAFGLSFSSYLESVRLAEGERLLLTTERDVTEIAATAGFGTTSYFIERFRIRYGLPPHAFRLKMRTQRRLIESENSQKILKLPSNA